jgi:hypothetical protein
MCLLTIVGDRHAERQRVASKLLSVAETNFRVGQKLVTYFVGIEKTGSTHPLHLPRL